MNENTNRMLEIAAKNLALWQKSAGENRELRLLQAQRLGAHCAAAWQEDELTDPSVLTLPSPVLPHSPLVANGAPLSHAMGVEEQIAFCRGYLSVAPFPLCEKETPLPPPPPAARVVFPDSYFAREALHALSPVLPHAIPMGAASFAAVCEELASDRADFALLPIEDSAEGELSRVLDEIDRMEFSITHTCEIPYRDENRSVTMALLAKRYRAKDGKGEKLLTVSILSEDAYTITDLTNAALCCGMPLRRITSRSVPYAKDGALLIATFVVDDGDVALFSAYLAARYPRAQITGTSTHLSSG